MPASAPPDFDRADAVLRSTMAGSSEHHLALIRRVGMPFDQFPWPPKGAELDKARNLISKVWGRRDATDKGRNDPLLRGTNRVALAPDRTIAGPKHQGRRNRPA